MKWKELKEFCNSLNEVQLEEKIRLWREYEAINDISASALEEDMYVEKSGSPDGCFPLSDYNGKKKDLMKVYDKGTPILNENF